MLPNFFFEKFHPFDVENFWRGIFGEEFLGKNFCGKSFWGRIFWKEFLAGNILGKSLVGRICRGIWGFFFLLVAFWYKFTIKQGEMLPIFFEKFHPIDVENFWKIFGEEFLGKNFWRRIFGEEFWGKNFWGINFWGRMFWKEFLAGNILGKSLVGRICRKNP